jgi:hypothetical protein
MTVFAVILPTPQPNVVDAIKREFAGEFFDISPTNWLVSGEGTSEEIIRRIGVYDRAKPGAASGNAIAFPVSNYFGRAPNVTWEWLKAKIEASPGV